MSSEKYKMPLATITTKDGTLNVGDGTILIEFCGADHKIYDIPLSILKDAIEFYRTEKMETKATVISS